MSEPLIPNMGPEQLSEINRALDMIVEGKRQAELAIRAGIDVDESVKKMTETEDKLLRIKSVYFPGE